MIWWENIVNKMQAILLKKLRRNDVVNILKHEMYLYMYL